MLLLSNCVTVVGVYLSILAPTPRQQLVTLRYACTVVAPCCNGHRSRACAHDKIATVMFGRNLNQTPCAALSR
eukprot:8983-Heterococcus_DN1.PRE.5